MLQNCLIQMVLATFLLAMIKITTKSPERHTVAAFWSHSSRIWKPAGHIFIHIQETVKQNRKWIESIHLKARDTCSSKTPLPKGSTASPHSITNLRTTCSNWACRGRYSFKPPHRPVPLCTLSFCCHFEEVLVQHPWSVSSLGFWKNCLFDLSC